MDLEGPRAKPAAGDIAQVRMVGEEQHLSLAAQIVKHAQRRATRRRKPTGNQPPARRRIRQRCIIMTQPTLFRCRKNALSGHPRSLILFTCQRSHTRPQADIRFLSHRISRSLVIEGHRRSPSVTDPPPGGGGRDRTDDLMLAKHALSQLSYAPTGKDQREQWWAREDLNFRPHAYQARALTN